MKKITVNDLGEIITGHTPPTGKREFYGDAYPFLKPTDMVIGLKYTYEIEEGYSEIAAQKYKNSLIPRYSTCVVCIGTLGEKMCMAHCDLFTNQSVNSIIPNEKFDPHYVYYLLKYNLHRVKALNKGTASGREFVSKSTFLDLELDVYEDKATQKKVAGILSTFDNLIENNQKQIKLLEEAALRLYKEWFVDLRFPGYEETEIVDGVPEGWRYGSITDISICFDKSRKPLSSIERENQAKIYPYYGAASLMDYVEKYIFDGVYLLFGEDGTVITSDGTPMLQYVWGKFWVNNHAHVFQGKKEYSTEFLYMLCKHMKVSDVVTGVAQPKISQGRLNEKKILLPDKDLAAKYSKSTEPIFKRIRRLNDEVLMCKEARDRLLPKLMSGEIEV